MKSDCLTGIPVSQGIAIGPAFVYLREDPVVPGGEVDSGGEEAERRRIEGVFHGACAEIERKIARLGTGAKTQIEILQAQLELLRDPCMMQQIDRRIEDQHCCGEQAVWEVYQEMLEVFEALDDPVFRGRAADLRDVRDRLLRCCAGKPEPDLLLLDHPVILIARELSPSDTACLNKEYVLGIATEAGGATSHTAILARAGGIPAVLGVEGLLKRARNGEQMVLDATAGKIILSPQEADRKAYQAARQQWLRDVIENESYLSEPAVTKDGVRIATEVNLGSVADAYSKAAEGADGVGLLRTEFLYMEAGELPDEERQTQVYSEVLQAFQDRPVLLRTLDIGGDKQLPYLDLPKEENPFLGLRAIRFCLTHQELFRTQLRAAYRASVKGNLWLMFPMVGNLEEFRKAKQICASVQRELEQQGIPYRRDVRLGIMIEIPSIALAADLAAKETDFASIGTNDLCQYTCAADRLNPEVAPYYRPQDPGLLRLIGHVARCYAAAGKPLGVCGELAGDPQTAPLLVGLGVRMLSMSPAALGGVRRSLANRSLKEMEEDARRMVEL